MVAKKAKIKKPSGLKKDGTPNVHWQRFEDRLQEFHNKDLNNWEKEDFLGYIFERYETYTGLPFALSYSGAPSKCKEMFCINRMLLTLRTEKPKIVKEYIDWIFDKVIIPQKMDISSLAFFFTASIIGKFKAEFRKKHVSITRATELPENIKEITRTFNIKTYGDLAFAKLAADQNNIEYVELFSKLESIDFNKEILLGLS